MSLRLKHLAAALFCLTGLIPVTSFAQNCDNLDKNSDWQAGMNKLTEHIDKEEYDAAIEAAKPLFAICPGMPSLNYYTAIAMREKDPARSLLYLQEAAKRTSQFSTSAAMSRKIWSALFDAEHPERTEAAVAQMTQVNMRLNAEIDGQKQIIAKKDEHINELEKRVLQADHDTTMKINANQIEVKSNYFNMMWTGAGIGLGGLLIAGGGLALALTVDNSDDHGSSYSVSTPYTAGWIMVGVGAGLTAAGAVITGIAGYQYTHIDVPDSDVTLSFDVSPMSAAFGVTF